MGLFNKFNGTAGRENDITKIKRLINESDAILIGAGSGLSTSAGLTYSGERFEKIFSDFIERYGFKDMYSAGFYPFGTQEEKWAYWSRHIYINRYDITPGEPYFDLLKLMKDKNYFVLTTNVDHQFQLAGFDENRIFATQGDYGLFQCANACHDRLYDNEKAIRAMIDCQKDCMIPAELVPKCPVCGGDMEVNLRVDDLFVEDEAWREASERYMNFLNKNIKKHILFFEIGVGMNTPVIIKYPFWKMTYQNPKAFYVCVNLGEAYAPQEIAKRSVCINEDIKTVLKLLER